ncbi:serine-threonine protein phosphatase [Cryptococcus neoformans Tu401-1]|nr:serine-threonine protein phosphatase [Cryptococcus neoformans var. grubii Bt85]OXG09974.1 serine-threonine protein phosphatase [Cryptococcus neoformans var. grubii Tu401-1]OXM75467.1 serine-threonine protein phosphatase [Cryptococcus neoformans var. grubii Bt63]
MTARQTIIIVSVVSLLLLYLFVHHITSSLEPSLPNVPSRDAGGAVYRQRLVAVGDLHGDINNAKKVLQMAEIIDDDSKWVASTDILVQTGDIVDRGAYADDIYRLMRSLRGQAASQGGKVVSILGNHEMMNAIGDWRYVTKSDIERFGGTKARQHALSAEGWLGQEWLANYSITALVPISPYPSSPTFSFTHGSLRPSYANLTPYPAAINDLGHSLLTKALTPPMAPPYPPNPYSGLPKGTTHEEADLYAEGGPLWWRGLAEREEGQVCEWAKDLKQKIGVRRIIGGHTPNFEKIVARCNASVIIIDTGISSAYGGVLSALEIIYTLTPVDRRGRDHSQDPLLLSTSSEPIAGLKGRFIEREEVHAIYEKSRKWLALEEREVVLD